MTKVQLRKFLHCYRDALAAAVLFLVFGFFLLYSQNIKVLISSGVTAKFMPTVVCVLGMGLSAINIVTETVKGHKKYHSGDEAVPETDVMVAVKSSLSVVFIILYLVLVGQIGFVLASVLYLFGQISLLSEAWKKKWWLYLIIAVVISVACYLFFRNVFNLMLPKGILPF